MAILATATIGPLEAATVQVVLRPATAPVNGPAMVYLHGGGGTAFQVLAQGEVANIAVSYGWTVYSVLSLNPDHWATDAAVTSLQSTINTIRGYGHSHVVVHGVSMGAALALRHQMANPGSADGMIITVPAVDLEFLSSNANSPLTGTPLLAAWGGQAAWDAVAKNVNPARFPQKFSNIQLWYSEDDTLFGTSPGFINTVKKFAREAQCETWSLGYKGHVPEGHTPSVVGRYLWQAIEGTA